MAKILFVDTASSQAEHSNVGREISFLIPRMHNLFLRGDPPRSFIDYIGSVARITDDPDVKHPYMFLAMVAKDLQQPARNVEIRLNCPFIDWSDDSDWYFIFTRTDAPSLLEAKKSLLTGPITSTASNDSFVVYGSCGEWKAPKSDDNIIPSFLYSVQSYYLKFEVHKGVPEYHEWFVQFVELIDTPSEAQVDTLIQFGRKEEYKPTYVKEARLGSITLFGTRKTRKAQVRYKPDLEKKLGTKVEIHAYCPQ